MGRTAMKWMGFSLAVGVTLVACGSSDSTFGDGSNGGKDGGNNNGGGFGDDGGDGGGGGGGSQLAQCATGDNGTSRLPVYMDIVLDGSQSMDGHGKPTTQVPCDLGNKYPPANGGTCFLANRREKDPLANP